LCFSALGEVSDCWRWGETEYLAPRLGALESTNTLHLQHKMELTIEDYDLLRFEWSSIRW